MKELKVDDVKSVGIIGHGSTGKTSLSEAMLFNCKEIDRMGRIEDGTTVCDYDPEEKKRKISISTAIASCEWKKHRLYIVDTPGYFDFYGEVIEGIKAVDSAIINVCAVSGVQVGTEKSWNLVNKFKTPRAFFINRLDRENADFYKVYKSIKNKFGTSAVALQLPIGTSEDFKGIVDIVSNTAQAYDNKTKNMVPCSIPQDMLEMVKKIRNELVESVAETDEKLLDEYLNTGEISEDEIVKGLKTGIASCDISPVFCGSSYENIGIQSFLDSIVKYMPSQKDNGEVAGKGVKAGEVIKRIPDEKEPFSAFVFKTIADPFVGRLSLFKVVSGTIKSDSSVYNSMKDKTEKIGTLFVLKGKSQIAVQTLKAGDIGAVSKLQYTMTGDTLCSMDSPIVFENLVFPEPCISMSLTPMSKGDEDKISTGLAKLLEEDPTFKVSRDAENAETIVSGMGELHVEIIASKLKNKFGVGAALGLPRVPYRETIKKSADVQGKYKKQSGGHGQYGDVWIKFEHQNDGEDMEFVDAVVGGAVPRQYIPAVEKGLKEAIKHGVLAGYPVINLKATLHDGSYHPVDSSEMAFKTAASLAYKKGLKEAGAVLLEPIMHAEITVPDENMGEIIGDMNRRRGRVLGMDPKDGVQVIICEVPMSEMFKYATDLRSMTQARGSFTSKFERYEETPPVVSQKIIEAYEKSKEQDA